MLVTIAQIYRPGRRREYVRRTQEPVGMGRVFDGGSEAQSVGGAYGGGPQIGSGDDHTAAVSAWGGEVDKACPPDTTSITSQHRKVRRIAYLLSELSARIQRIRTDAEQFADAARRPRLVRRIFHDFGRFSMVASCDLTIGTGSKSHLGDERVPILCRAAGHHQRGAFQPPGGTVKMIKLRICNNF